MRRPRGRCGCCAPEEAPGRSQLLAALLAGPLRLALDLVADPVPGLRRPGPPYAVGQGRGLDHRLAEHQVGEQPPVDPARHRRHGRSDCPVAGGAAQVGDDELGDLRRVAVDRLRESALDAGHPVAQLRGLLPGCGQLGPGPGARCGPAPRPGPASRSASTPTSTRKDPLLHHSAEPYRPGLSAAPRISRRSRSQRSLTARLGAERGRLVVGARRRPRPGRTAARRCRRARRGCRRSLRRGRASCAPG